MIESTVISHHPLSATIKSALYVDDHSVHRLSTKFDCQFCNPEPDQIEYQRQQAEQQLSIEGVVLLNEHQIENAKQQASSDSRIDEKYCDLLDKVRPLTQLRRVSQVDTQTLSAIDELYSRFPNFREVVEEVEKQLKLQLIADGELRLDPILLVGPPGCGKTVFAETLAEVLESEVERIRVGLLSESFSISGLELGYNTGGPGQVIKSLINCDTANPFFVLDEIDKGRSHESRSSVFSAFYDLLEEHSAEKFTDVAVNLPVNCSHLNWIATANELEPIPEPLQSRFHIFHVEQPSQEQRQLIIAQIWSGMLNAEKWGKQFDLELSSDCLQVLGTLSPRQIRRTLRSAAGSAVTRLGEAPFRLMPSDITIRKIEKQKRRIGF